jgi:hypothetical protein
MGDQDTQDESSYGGLPYEPDMLDAETRERLERERQARVHQEAHEPTGDWCELAEDPDAWTEKTAEVRETLIRDEEFKRGVRIGRAEAEAELINGQLLETSGPRDYDIWRDALLIASPIFAGGGDAQEVLNIARHVIRPSLRNCGDISADDEAVSG